MTTMSAGQNYNLNPSWDQPNARLPDATTAEGRDLVNTALQERIRFAEPVRFQNDTTLTNAQTQEIVAQGGNVNAPDPARYSMPSAEKDYFATRRAVIAQQTNATPMYQVGTPEEVALMQEAEAQRRIMEYDKYCAAMFNYKAIPGGLKAMEEINPGFTARRVAQVYSDAAFAAKIKAIEVLGQANCGHEANKFKFDVDNKIITGPRLRDHDYAADTGYVRGGVGQFARNYMFNTYRPGGTGGRVQQQERGPSVPQRLNLSTAPGGLFQSGSSRLTLQQGNSGAAQIPT